MYSYHVVFSGEELLVSLEILYSWVLVAVFPCSDSIYRVFQSVPTAPDQFSYHQNPCFWSLAFMEIWLQDAISVPSASGTQCHMMYGISKKNSIQHCAVWHGGEKIGRHSTLLSDIKSISRGTTFLIARHRGVTFGSVRGFALSLGCPQEQTADYEILEWGEE